VNKKLQVVCFKHHEKGAFQFQAHLILPVSGHHALYLAIMLVLVDEDGRGKT
jgi:hypothetical protein